MGESRYKKCKALMEYFEKGDEVGLVRLTEKIVLNIGADERTVTECLKLMMTMKMIRDIGNCHFRIL